MATVSEIADQILISSPVSISHRELQKLLYFAQGFHLAATGEPLFNERLSAWKFGPVNSTIWARFRDYGYHTLNRPQAEPVLEDRIKHFIAAFVIVFASIGEYKLIEYSHLDIPWASTYAPNVNNEISRETIRGYFSQFAGMEDYVLHAERKLMFNQLIKQRIAYLDNLPTLRANWIGANSAAPSAQVCSVAASFLRDFERFVLLRNAHAHDTKLVLGPIPTGGVGIEMSNEAHSLYVSLHNDFRVEVDTETNGHFVEEETTLAQFEEDFIPYFERLVA